MHRAADAISKSVQPRELPAQSVAATHCDTTRRSAAPCNDESICD